MGLKIFVQKSRLTDAPNVTKTCGYDSSKQVPSTRPMSFDLSERRISFNASSVVFDVSEPCPVRTRAISKQTKINKTKTIIK